MSNIINYRLIINSIIPAFQFVFFTLLLVSKLLKVLFDLELTWINLVSGAF
jgi:hypothetical protein